MVLICFHNKVDKMLCFYFIFIIRQKLHNQLLLSPYFSGILIHADGGVPQYCSGAVIHYLGDGTWRHMTSQCISKESVFNGKELYCCEIMENRKRKVKLNNNGWCVLRLDLELDGDTSSHQGDEFIVIDVAVTIGISLSHQGVEFLLV